MDDRSQNRIKVVLIESMFWFTYVEDRKRFGLPLSKKTKESCNEAALSLYDENEMFKIVIDAQLFEITKVINSRDELIRSKIEKVFYELP